MNSYNVCIYENKVPVREDISDFSYFGFIKIFKGEIKKDVKKSFDPLIVKTFYIRSPSPFKVAISVQEYLESSSSGIRHTFLRDTIHC